MTGRPVAIIDDDPAVLASLRFLLEVAGHEVAVYPSGDAFLADSSRQPACLILDHHMPRMTGLELTARLRSAGEATPVLLITASSSPALLERAHALGIEKVMEKPVPEAELLRFVEAHH